MKKIMALIAALAVTACAPVMVANQKTVNYDKRITKLSIVVAEPNAFTVKQQGPLLATTVSTTSATPKAMADLQKALRNALPMDFSAVGVPATLVANLAGAEDTKSGNESSHALTIVPTGANTGCNYSRCQTTVFVSAELRDLNVNTVAWVGKFEVPQASSFNHIDIETAHRVTALLIDTFRLNNLMPPIRK